jgi:hypothetical protein
MGVLNFVKPEQIEPCNLKYLLGINGVYHLFLALFIVLNS